MAKSLYSALFDWIVFRTNHALLNNKDLEDNSKVREKNTSVTSVCLGAATQQSEHFLLWCSQPWVL